MRERNATAPNNDAITFYHADHLGSVNAVTGSGGSTLAQMRYKRYGEISTQSVWRRVIDDEG